MQVRVYNDFKRRLLNGEVSADFPCTALLLNSKFDTMYDRAAYFRNMEDFNSYSAGSLYKSHTYGVSYYGSLLANGNVLETTYYRDVDLNESDMNQNELMIVTSANSAEYASMYARGTTQQNERFADYIDKYGYFYLVARADDFHALVSKTQSLNMERFVVVLADNIEHIDVIGSCFGCSKEYPFRGIFDGNGYALCLHSMQMNERSNGVFGYVSDEAIIRNLIISADSTNLDATDSEILVTNAEQISINTLKAGLGDVKFGILAGTNNGTVENILVDAKLHYISDFTPSVSFVQNKIDNPTTLIGSNWSQVSSTDISAVTGLSAFDNICYPTQLCLNSEANMIPYVGYFNEGSFNSQTVPYSVTHDNQLYDTSTRHDETTSYFADIYDLYKAKGDAYNSTANYLELIGDKTHSPDGSITSNDVVMSFRLGPNNKQAFLLGGMFGLNNGNVEQCVCDVQMKFNDNVVALAGGLAARGGRGNIHNVAARAKFIGTSGTYNHNYQITNEKFENALASSMFKVQNYARNSYSADDIWELSPTKVTKFDWDAEHNRASNISANFGTLTYAQPDTYESYNLDVDTHGILTLIGSGYQLTDTEVHQTDIDLAGKDVCLIYNYNLTAELYNPSGACNPRIFNSAKVSGKWVNGYDESWNETFYESIYDTALPVLTHKLSDTNLYAISSRTTNGIKLLTSQTHLVIASAVSNTQCRLTNNEINVGNLKLYTDYAMFKRDVAGISGSITYQLSSYDVNITYDQTPENIRALSTMQEYPDIDIRLAPVFNMGGMFGEYIYSNDQSVTNSLACAEACGFKWPKDATSKTRGFSKFNNVSHFASNIVIDSSNKSNYDMFSTSFASSANARIQNDLKFRIATITDGDDSGGIGYSAVRATVSATVDSDDCTSAIKSFNTLCIYNHITPSVVTTNYTDRDDEDIDDVDDTAPNLGITWLDQLFYSYGLNMGYNKILGDVDAGDYKAPYKQFNNPSAVSGWYFNFPAQGKEFDGFAYTNERSPVSADDASNRYDRRLWHYDTLFNSVYKLTDTPYYSASYEYSNLYVSKQLTAYPSHYPLYRGRATIDTTTHNLTYAQSAYLTVPTEITMTAYSAIDDKKAELLAMSNDLHKNIVTESYIYEYTQNIYSNMLPQLNTHLYSVYGSFTSYGTETEVENAYVISSDSCDDIYKKNGYATTEMIMGECTITVPSTGLPQEFNIDVGIASMTECVTGAIVDFSISKELLDDDTPTLSVQGQRCYLTSGDSRVSVTALDPALPASALATVYENKLYVVYPFTIPVNVDDLYLSIPLQLSYKSNGSDELSMTTAHIPFRRAEVDSRLFKFSIDNKTREDNILSANTLCFGFVPTEENIIDVLDRSSTTSAYAKTLSSDDISYMLLLDNEQRPIVDMKFDTTAVASAGFYVEFEGLRHSHYQTNKELSSGLLINITK